MSETTPTVNHDHVLRTLKAGYQNIVLAGNQGFRCEIRRLDDETIIAVAKGPTAEEAKEAAILTAAEKMGVSTKIATTDDALDARIKQLESDGEDMQSELRELRENISNMTTKLDEISNQIIAMLGAQASSDRPAKGRGRKKNDDADTPASEQPGDPDAGLHDQD